MTFLLCTLLTLQTKSSEAPPKTAKNYYSTSGNLEAMRVAPRSSEAFEYTLINSVGVTRTRLFELIKKNIRHPSEPLVGYDGSWSISNVNDADYYTFGFTGPKVSRIRFMRKESGGRGELNSMNLWFRYLMFPKSTKFYFEKSEPKRAFDSFSKSKQMYRGPQRAFYFFADVTLKNGSRAILKFGTDLEDIIDGKYVFDPVTSNRNFVWNWKKARPGQFFSWLPKDFIDIDALQKAYCYRVIVAEPSWWNSLFTDEQLPINSSVPWPTESYEFPRPSQVSPLPFNLFYYTQRPI